MRCRCDGLKQLDDGIRCQKAREIVTNAVHNQITKQRAVLWAVRRCMCRAMCDTALETHAMYENASLIKERMSRLHTTG